MSYRRPGGNPQPRGHLEHRNQKEEEGEMIGNEFSPDREDDECKFTI